MVRFLSRRVLRALVSLLGVLTIVFFIVRINGSPAVLLLGPDASAEAVADLDRALGLDRSLPVQYLSFLRSTAVGDFGESLNFNRPALGLILTRLPDTLLLAVSAFAFGLVVAFGLAVVAELWGNRTFRDALLWIGAVVQSVPTFLLGIVLILVFAVTLRLLPALGAGSATSLILPAVTLGCFEVALYVRLFSVAIAEQVGQDYVRTAYAKGRSKLQVTLGHVLPNAVLPVVTVAGINLGQLIGGTVVVETVFNWPGAGSLIYQGVTGRDYPIVQAGVVVVATLFILINLGVDMLYAVLDPRVRLS